MDSSSFCSPGLACVTLRSPHSPHLSLFCNFPCGLSLLCALCKSWCFPYVQLLTEHLKLNSTLQTQFKIQFSIFSPTLPSLADFYLVKGTTLHPGDLFALPPTWHQLPGVGKFSPCPSTARLSHHPAPHVQTWLTSAASTPMPFPLDSPHSSTVSFPGFKSDRVTACPKKP